MSQCSAEKRRSSLTSLYLTLILLLSGCSFAELEEFATENDPAEEQQAESGSSGKKSKSAILVPDHVIRGGSWSEHPWRCRSACRTGCPPEMAISDLGFRVVVEDSEK